MRIVKLLNILQTAKRAFRSADILAPVLAGRPVGAQIAGTFYELQVDDPHFEGWAVLRPFSSWEARIVRQPRLTEIAAYLWLFPAIRLVAVAREGQRWYALPAESGDSRLIIEEPVPIALVEEDIQPFEPLIARFDGQTFLYERRNARRNPALALYLRQALDEGVQPSDLNKPGLSAEERATYAWAWQALKEQRYDRTESLLHSGSSVQLLTEQTDGCTTTYQVDSEHRIRAVQSDDLTLTAGFCLSGPRHSFEFTRLAGALRQAFAQRNLSYVPRDE